MENLEPIIILIAQALGGLTIVATVVVRFIPDPNVKAQKKKYAEIIWKIISYLPTIGINPKTKKLEKAYLELQEEATKP
jgi:hypothetical protein